MNTIREKIEKGKHAIAKAKARGQDTAKWEAYVKRLIEQEADDMPHWYTEEDRKAVSALKGICGNCAYQFASRNNGEFKGLWCEALKKKLETKIESCPEFYALGDELSRLKKEMGLSDGNTSLR
jgi:hypothetical protein